MCEDECSEQGSSGDLKYSFEQYPARRITIANQVYEGYGQIVNVNHLD